METHWVNSINSRRFHPASCGNALIELPASIEKGLTVSVDFSQAFLPSLTHLDWSQQKTTFVTHCSLHEFRVMPFGLKNTTVVFQHLMQEVLVRQNPTTGAEFVSLYINNILVFPRLWISTFTTRSLSYLGCWRIGSSWNQSSATSYNGKWVISSAHKDWRPVRRTFVWWRSSQYHVMSTMSNTFLDFHPSIGDLSLHLRGQHIRCMPLPGRELYLSGLVSVKRPWMSWRVTLTCADLPQARPGIHTGDDVSGVGVGAALSQRQEDGKIHPIAYASWALSPCEWN